MCVWKIIGDIFILFIARSIVKLHFYYLLWMMKITNYSFFHKDFLNEFVFFHNPKCMVFKLSCCYCTSVFLLSGVINSFVIFFIIINNNNFTIYRIGIFSSTVTLNIVPRKLYKLIMSLGKKESFTIFTTKRNQSCPDVHVSNFLIIILLSVFVFLHLVFVIFRYYFLDLPVY